MSGHFSTERPGTRSGLIVQRPQTGVLLACSVAAPAGQLAAIVHGVDVVCATQGGQRHVLQAVPLGPVNRAVQRLANELAARVDVLGRRVDIRRGDQVAQATSGRPGEDMARIPSR